MRRIGVPGWCRGSALACDAGNPGSIPGWSKLASSGVAWWYFLGSLQHCCWLVSLGRYGAMPPQDLPSLDSAMPQIKINK